MTMRSQSGAFRLNMLDDCATGSSEAMRDVPADLTEQPSELFDKLVAFTSDLLGRQTVELRLHEAGIPMRLDSGARTYRKRRA
jgi:hypothetical protein